MKFSIIIGVIQMLFGTILKGCNGVYFGKWEDVLFEAIPQFLFMFCTFGYMSIAIIIKWLTDWTGKEPISIIQMFINFTSVETPLFGDGKLQGGLQSAFLYICMVSFFVMLIPKPIVVYCRQKKPKSHKKEKEELFNVDNSDERILGRSFLSFYMFFITAE